MALIKIEGNAKFEGKTIFDAGYRFQDSNAEAYVAAVELADGSALENGVKEAYDAFIVGCKSDGIWSALKASCIMAGARTLNGALVPLVGTAPTNNNFVSADYDRKTGLVGNGSTKYLNSNRNNNADPQNDKHLAVFSQSTTINASFRCNLGLAGDGGSQTGASVIGIDTNANTYRYRVNGSTAAVVASNLAGGLIAVSRQSSSQIETRHEGATTTTTSTSETPLSINYHVFARKDTLSTSATNYSNARLSFYSIGESLDLAALDSRVSNLMTAINAAI